MKKVKNTEKINVTKMAVKDQIIIHRADDDENDCRLNNNKPHVGKPEYDPKYKAYND